jgi:hypothetical protein
MIRGRHAIILAHRGWAGDFVSGCARNGISQGTRRHGASARGAEPAAT